MLKHYSPLVTGLGDRLIDYVGLATIAHLHNSQLELYITLKDKNRNYNFDLINIPNTKIIIENSYNVKAKDSIKNGEIFINYNSNENPKTLTSNAIIKLKKNFNLKNISFEKINETYKSIFQNITTKLNYKEYNDYIGIHLRTGDKINNNLNIPWFMTQKQYDKLIDVLIYYIINNKFEKFVIFGESNKDIDNFINRVKEIHNDIIIINGSKMHTGKNAPIQDLFSLSSTKKIVQGINYSTFSMSASLLGDKELINFSKICDLYKSMKWHFDNFNNIIDLNFNPNDIQNNEFFNNLNTKNQKEIKKENLRKILLIFLIILIIIILVIVFIKKCLIK
jgi:hypothetical protein